MADSRHEAVWNWLMECRHIGDLFFNASRPDGGSTVLIPSEQLVEKYIDGSARYKYICELTRFLPYSPDPNDIENITQLVDFSKISEWIEEQLEDGNLPEFPDDCVIGDIEVLPNQSGFMVAQDYTSMKYRIQFSIEYDRNAGPYTTYE